MASINTNLVYTVLRMEFFHYFPRDPDTYLLIKFLVLRPWIPSYYITNIIADRTTISILPREIKQ
jgi:hypothetical protein